MLTHMAYWHSMYDWIKMTEINDIYEINMRSERLWPIHVRFYFEYHIALKITGKINDAYEL